MSGKIQTINAINIEFRSAIGEVVTTTPGLLLPEDVHVTEKRLALTFAFGIPDPTGKLAGVQAYSITAASEASPDPEPVFAHLLGEVAAQVETARASWRAALGGS